MKTLYLIGFMGSGKSTVGELLHYDLGISYLDTDQMVVEKYGEIAAIFQQEGEDKFRDYETEMLTKTSPENYIVSTGGGIVEREENMAFMKNNGRIIYLDTSFAQIADRLGNDPSRPLWRKNQKDKQKLYQRRAKWYRQLADFTVMTDQKSPEDIAGEILKILEH
ncbi:shikimate kinase [Lentibacillus halodurans]|uniref:Shikimate kinase n=1 Tax=Lentibacillus halodurans TaxID=237679 RepID=A0A1I0V4V3_9BACI|nr:shikimate kinase [Lentibacillus halodurans]SFA71292.1 shikimate kinase [Lentibacillus halodurans]